jgi:hypothetical protein
MISPSRKREGLNMEISLIVLAICTPDPTLTSPTTAVTTSPSVHSYLSKRSFTEPMRALIPDLKTCLSNVRNLTTSNPSL